jgi:TetR/AcrR family transcriptional regulator, transcriptional repressor for nem operon
MPMEDTKKKILDLAENLLQSKGYNGFSYKNISVALGIKNAAVHYHFPTKKNLGIAVIQRARQQFKMWIHYISDQKAPFEEVLEQLFNAYVQFMKSGNIICLGGSLETDFHTLPMEMQQETRFYVSEMIQWLTELFSEGRKQGIFTFSGRSENKAMQVLSCLQGAIQMVRAYDESLFYGVLSQIKIELGV